MTYFSIEAAIFIVIVAIIASVGFSEYARHQSPTIEINKKDCGRTKFDSRSHLQPTQAGKIMIMQSSTRTACVEYRRHSGW